MKPPVLLVHGDQDEVIPAQALFLSAQGLGGMGLAVEWHLSQGIGHGIDGDGLRLGGPFFRKPSGDADFRPLHKDDTDPVIYAPVNAGCDRKDFKGSRDCTPPCRPEPGPRWY